MTNKRFLVLLGVAALIAVLALAQAIPDTAKDPVCGMTVKTAGAKYTYDYKGTTYYFCSEGCKTSFSKEPEKYLKPTDVTKPMGQGMMGKLAMKPKMMGQHMQMAGGEQAASAMDNCPMMMKDVEKTVVNTKDGVTITLSSKNPETLKKIQEWAAQVKSGGMGKMDEAGCPMGANCPMKKK